MHRESSFAGESADPWSAQSFRYCWAAAFDTFPAEGGGLPFTNDRPIALPSLELKSIRSGDTLGAAPGSGPLRGALQLDTHLPDGVGMFWAKAS
jgi:hypothetical protein